MLQIGTTNYLYGMERLAAHTGSARTWYGADALGSVRQTLDAAGVPQATISDDPWGYSRGQGSGIRGQERCGSTTRRLIRQPVQQCCPPLQVQTGSVPTFGVTGDLHDGATGLVHLRARWYNARHGTLTSVDPFWDAIADDKGLQVADRFLWFAYVS